MHFKDKLMIRKYMTKYISNQISNYKKKIFNHVLIIYSLNISFFTDFSNSSQ